MRRGERESSFKIYQSLEAQYEYCELAYNSSDLTLFEDTPAIQSTAMPSTRLMPVVITSSRHVWSRFAREIRFSPMSVQYTVSLPVREEKKKHDIYPSQP